MAQSGHRGSLDRPLRRPRTLVCWRGQEGVSYGRLSLLPAFIASNLIEEDFSWVWSSLWSWPSHPIRAWRAEHRC